MNSARKDYDSGKIYNYYIIINKYLFFNIVEKYILIYMFLTMG